MKIVETIRDLISGGSRKPEYDAFISYNHDDDGDLAPALQKAMQRFAKPWYQPRALRIFRDKASMTAGPELWEPVEKALATSRWFVLLASQGAARSTYVGREVRWWLGHRSIDHLLVVATAKGLTWDRETGDWAVGAPIPDALRGRPEPRIASLSDVERSADHLALPEDAMADIVGPIRGREKEQIVGDHRRERRRALRHALTAIAVSMFLAIASIYASVIAVGQRDKAVTQAKIATAREVAGLSSEYLSSHLDLAQLLAVAGFGIDNGPLTRTALLQAVMASPHLVRYLQVGAKITDLGVSADGHVVVAGTINGDLVSFNLANRSRKVVHALQHPVSQISVSDNGATIIASGGAEVIVWSPSEATPLRNIVARRVAAISVSPSGQVAVYCRNIAKYTIVTAKNLVTGATTQVRLSTGCDRISILRQSEVLISEIFGAAWEFLRFPALKVIAHGGAPSPPGDTVNVAGASSDGAYFGYAVLGNVTAWPTMDHKQQPAFSANSLSPPNLGSALTISDDGKYAALAEGGTIYVGPLGSYAPGKSGVRGRALVANDVISGLSFIGGDSQLVAVTGDAISLWNLNQTSRLGQQPGIRIPPVPVNDMPPRISFSPNGRTLAVMGVVQGMDFYEVNNSFRKVGGLRRGYRYSDGQFVIWHGNNPQFLSEPGEGSYLELDNEKGRKLRELPLAQPPYLVAAQLMPGGSDALLVGGGYVEVLNLRTGLVRLTPLVRPSIDQPEFVAVSPDCRTVVLGEINRNVIIVNPATGTSRVIGKGGDNGLALIGNRLYIQRASGIMQIWDSAGRHMLATLPGDQSYASSFAVSTDGREIARLNQSGVLSIVSVSGDNVLASFQLPSPADGGGSSDPWTATAMLFAPDGKSLITATVGGRLLRWETDPWSLVKLACATVGRALTPVEWRRYVRLPLPPKLPCQ